MNGIRRLPWAGEGGQPCYLSTDGASGLVMSRVADNLETMYLGMAADLLDYVDDALSNENLSEAELRSTVMALRQSVRDVARVAQCRGERLTKLLDDKVSSAVDAMIDQGNKS